MENLSGLLVSQVLNSLDPNPVSPTKQQLYLSFLVCKNLTDLCETGRAIVNNIESHGHPLDGLPDRDSIALCQQILREFYDDNMFIPDEEFGNKPNWDKVNKFNQDQSNTAYKIYRAIRKNIIEKPGGKDIQGAIQRKDKKFFLENFDKIFADVPFKDGLIKFKNFIASPYTRDEDQSYVWDFFESLIDIYIYEQDNLEDLRHM
ncbi:hypothetical protein BH23THE1_BH23THE1_32380 [soil metagenome]